MEENDECGCSSAQSINELCPKCRFDYDQYLATMAMLRSSVAKAESQEVQDADAA